MDNSIDQAIFDAVVANLTPPPAIVRPFFDYDGEVGTFLQGMEAHYAAFARQVTDMSADGEKARIALKMAFEENDVMPHHLANMDTFTIKVEERAAQHAIEMRGLLKQVDRMFRSLGSYAPSQRDAAAQLSKRLVDLTKKELDEYSNMALFARALKAEYDPEARGGREFSDSTELSRYLANLVA